MPWGEISRQGVENGLHQFQGLTVRVELKLRVAILALDGQTEDASPFPPCVDRLGSVYPPQPRPPVHRGAVQYREVLQELVPEFGVARVYPRLDGLERIGIDQEVQERLDSLLAQFRSVPRQFRQETLQSRRLIEPSAHWNRSMVRARTRHFPGAPIHYEQHMVLHLALRDDEKASACVAVFRCRVDILVRVHVFRNDLPGPLELLFITCSHSRGGQWP